MRTLITRLTLSCARWFWNPHSHGRTLFRSAEDDQFPSQQGSSLTHSQETERPAACELLFADAPAVIVNFQRQMAVLLRQPYSHLAGVRVPGDVRQSFLENAEHRRRAFLIDFNVISREIQPAPRPSASLEFLRRPFQRGYEAEVIKDSRPQFCRDSAH